MVYCKTATCNFPSRVHFADERPTLEMEVTVPVPVSPIQRLEAWRESFLIGQNCLWPQLAGPIAVATAVATAATSAACCKCSLGALPGPRLSRARDHRLASGFILFFRLQSCRQLPFFIPRPGWLLVSNRFQVAIVLFVLLRRGSCYTCCYRVAAYRQAQTAGPSLSGDGLCKCKYLSCLGLVQIEKLRLFSQETETATRRPVCWPWVLWKDR